MKIDKQFAGAMAELKLAESTPSPDAALIAACERYMRLRMKSSRAPRDEEERGRLQREVDEMIELSRAIPGFRPVTAAGRRAKAQSALCSLEQKAGTQNLMARAAILDYLVNDAHARPFMSGQLPENDPMVWDQDERLILRRYRLMGDAEKARVRLYVAQQFEAGESQSAPAG